MTLPRPIVIVGPTAGGKSELAVLVAETLDPRGEVINADSMQVYRGMDAGTAKPQAAMRARVVHHLIDMVEPTERFTVADWLERAERLIGDMQARGVRPIIVGGTNLYLKALLEGMFDGPGHDPALRAELALLPAGELHQRLAAVDPAAAERIHPNDAKKLVRAIEVFTLTGKPISGWQRQWEGEGGERKAESGKAKSITTATHASPLAPPPSALRPPSPYRFNPILIGLGWPVESINRRINARVKEMFFPAACGLVCESLPDEVRRLDAAQMLGPQAREALGYKQILEHFQGQGSLDDACERTKILTRRFAKTQRTWLRRYRGVSWLPADSVDAGTLAARALGVIRSADGAPV